MTPSDPLHTNNSDATVAEEAPSAQSTVDHAVHVVMPEDSVPAIAAEAPQPTPSPSPDVAPVPEKPATRLRALDAFRGLTIVLMLLVNNIALDSATPAQLQHAAWNAGVHIADLVFPWFLFAVGVAIPFAAASAKRKGMTAWRYDIKVLLRTASLVALGVLIDNSIQRQLNMQHTFIFVLGVLQIIGLAYLVAALLYDLPISRRILIAFSMLVLYWAAIKYLPIPGVGIGRFTEDQNFITHLNRTYFSAVYLWGIPSVVPTAAMVLIGTLIGDIFRRRDLQDFRRIALLVLTGLALTGIGVLWNTSLPYNKPIWTPSYVLLTAGLGTLLLALLYLVVDAAGWWKWSYPLLVFGSNAILAYVAPILTKVWILQSWNVKTAVGVLHIDTWLLNGAKTHLGAVPGGWIYTLGYLVAWWLILWQLYRKKIFLRV